MKRVVILHGWHNNSQGNWFQWLKTKLEKRGYEVSAPDFPNARFPQLEAWLEMFERIIGEPDEELILVDHSLGSVTILRYLERLPKDKQILAAILVVPFAAPSFTRPVPEISNFLTPDWDWNKIRAGAKRLFLINSDNDHFVPQSNSALVGKKLKQKMITIKGQGHFSLKASPKYKKFPFLLTLFDQIERA